MSFETPTKPVPLKTLCEEVLSKQADSTLGSTSLCMGAYYIKSELWVYGGYSSILCNLFLGSLLLTQ